VVGDDVVCLQLESDDATAICPDALEEAVALRYALLDQEAFALEELADGWCRLGRVGDDDSFGRHGGAVVRCLGGGMSLSAGSGSRCCRGLLAMEAEAVPATREKPRAITR
jgi:hypothetical protein